MNAIAIFSGIMIFVYICTTGLVVWLNKKTIDATNKYIEYTVTRLNAINDRLSDLESRNVGS
jgi:hypothetical protein